MKKLLFAAVAAVTFLRAPLAHAQTTTTSPAANTSMAPAADGWDWPASPSAAAPTGTNVAAIDDDADEAIMHSSGVLVAPGMNSSPYRGTSTDYNGRPVARRKSFRPRSVRTTSTDPMMASSGVMLAPGLSTSPYRAASTDYNGRPLQQPQPAPIAQPADAQSLAAGW
ncbi:hypothetical protein [Hymenobacter psychrophilus]|uniref:Uncharacterized protein n=1 Tax=Hymenobacter psychrophilus TaxID=651662 RepID=A0A1H3HMC9_9BACT|nr:hypothetical protein [Hymenobacter psychrophilus]SDY15944.1 hypothetical protein SAMN04488069_10634 [Hymenobacter psychrophilus]